MLKFGGTMKHTLLTIKKSKKLNYYLTIQETFKFNYDYLVTSFWINDWLKFRFD